MRASLRHFGITRPAFDLGAAIQALAGACRLADAAVRVTVTRGVGAALVPPPGLHPTTLVTAREVEPDLEALRSRGVAAIRLPFGHGQGGVGGGHKTLDYLPAVLGATLARRRHAREGLYVEADGTISEGTTSNLFAVVDGRLHTPWLASGCLPGITRGIVLTIARRAGLAVAEGVVSGEALDRAEELFLASSVIELLPVVRLDGRKVGDGRPGALTRRLQESYRRLVQRMLARKPRARS
jgi:branched-subunit amino acid aminotransferase/4-amino-4-deoxychorismate lyase